MKKIVYLGNDLSQNSKYHSAFATLKYNLKKENYSLITASSKKNQFLRLLDMLLRIVRYAYKVDYVLIDTFSTNAFYFAFLCSQLARFFKIKYIPVLHGGNLPDRLESFPKMSKMIFSNSVRNVAPSGYLQQCFEKKGFKTLLIPNTIDIKSYRFKERSNLTPKILYVRAFASIYNPNMALEVLKNVQKQYPKATLCMVGPDRDGSLNDFKNKMKDLDLEDSVTITGVLPREEWHKLSETYDVFINTTNIDNTPVSLIEVMALGIPIVTTNVGGIPYLIDDQQDGILVDVNNATEMANAIVDLINNSKKSKRLSNNARNKAEQMDWEVVKYKWRKILV